MKRLSSLLLVLVAGGIFAGGGLLYVRGEEETAARRADRNDAERPVPVGVVEVSEKRFADRIEALGTARADEFVTLTAKVSDTVEAIHFEDGAFVEQGEVLVELERNEERAEVERYQAQLREAEQQLERTRELVARANASESELDARIRAVSEAEAQLAGARARLSNRVIRAPFAGILGLRRISVGTLVSPGDEITTLDAVSPIKLDFSIAERFLTAVQPGQEVIAQAAAYPGETFRGTVTTVSSRVYPVTRALTVRSRIPNEDARLRPGMLMTVNVVSRERLATSVPEEAIVPEGREQYVFVVDEAAGTVERRPIRLGLRKPGRVEVRAGLKPGELVVVSGVQRLRPGAAITINERGAIPVDRPPA